MVSPQTEETLGRNMGIGTGYSPTKDAKRLMIKNRFSTYIYLTLFVDRLKFGKFLTFLQNKREESLKRRNKRSKSLKLLVFPDQFRSAGLNSTTALWKGLVNLIICWEI